MLNKLSNIMTSFNNFISNIYNKFTTNINNVFDIIEQNMISITNEFMFDLIGSAIIVGACVLSVTFIACNISYHTRLQLYHITQKISLSLVIVIVLLVYILIFLPNPKLSRQLSHQLVNLSDNADSISSYKELSIRPNIPIPSPTNHIKSDLFDSGNKLCDNV